MAGQPKRMRAKAQLPPCYYEGYLEKRSPNEKNSRKLWTCLCGNTLFFFNTTMDSNYTEKLDLGGFISLMDDVTRSLKLDAAQFTLRMTDSEVKFSAPSLEARELWKGYIYAVVTLTVPSSLNLLPGQVHMLREVIDAERERAESKPPALSSAPPALPSAPPALPSGPGPALYVPLQADMPACYHKVSRTEAEILLERNQEQGNFLLRPGRAAGSLAITTYQDLNGPVFRHYRVARNPDGGFSIDVLNPIPCATLHDVVTYMVEMTAGTMRPLILEDQYDEKITFIHSNNENGERSLQSASIVSNAIVPIPTPKPGHLTEREESLDMEFSFDDIFYMNIPSSVEDKTTAARSLTPPPNLARKALLPKTLLFPSSSPITVVSAKKTKLPKAPSFSSSSPPEGQENSTPGVAGDKPKPPPKADKPRSALLPKSISFPSLVSEEQNSRSSADRQDIRPPVPAPRVRPTDDPRKVRRATMSSVPDDHLAAALSEELKEKLKLREKK
ncbi:hypothetical protein COCON_G00059700 [Conger conger]|uniref:Signal-transducing adaptor protein 2 n=1 Tax=Conger conger TaxID=82655 RepID=A0A9Q1DR92_CONCO|nr:hypothetical protein COCON_G00059700 [Conger conger]